MVYKKIFENIKNDSAEEIEEFFFKMKINYTLYFSLPPKVKYKHENDIIPFKNKNGNGREYAL